MCRRQVLWGRESLAPFGCAPCPVPRSAAKNENKGELEFDCKLEMSLTQKLLFSGCNNSLEIQRTKTLIMLVECTVSVSEDSFVKCL